LDVTYLGSHAAAGTGDDGHLAGQRKLWLRGINRGVNVLVDILGELEAVSSLVLVLLETG
jgi:hypothetical protein